ncbi:MAG: leucine-rich repeat domain-containing protein, partial [Bacteroidota bacterium]
MTPNIKRAEELIKENAKNQDTFLDLGNLGLTALPEALFELTHLKRLNLGFSYTKLNEKGKRERVSSQNDFLPNSLKDLSDRLSELVALEYLRFSNNWYVRNDFQNSYGSLFKKNNLGNQIKNLPLLENLRELDLSYNQITKIENLEPLANLNSLDLSYNQIT